MFIKNAIFRAFTYVRHVLTAWHTGGEGVHSPTLFYMVRMVLYDDNAYYVFPRIEQQRKALLRSTTTFIQQDYGTGVSADGFTEIPRQVSCIARTHLESAKIGQLLFRIVNHLTETHRQPMTVVELGTSLGITTSYLASASPKNRVQTYEGAEGVLGVAEEVWRTLELTNIEPIMGNIDDTLPKHCPEQVDFAYMDANHTYEATLRYFRQLLPHLRNQSIVVLDDIHHSPEMERAWYEIQSMQQVTSTIDCYHIGLVFFNKHYIRKNYRMRI